MPFKEGLTGQTQKNKNGLIDALDIFGIELSDATSELIFWHCRDFVDHQSRKCGEAITFAQRNRDTKQGRLGWISCRDTDGDRVASKQSSWRITAGRGLPASSLAPATVHSSPRFNQSPGGSEIASMKSWSRCAYRVCPTRCDCRRASALNAAVRVSGTQTWISRNPRARKRLRCA
jgi:hypothetical protein